MIANEKDWTHDESKQTKFEETINDEIESLGKPEPKTFRKGFIIYIVALVLLLLLLIVVVVGLILMGTCKFFNFINGNFYFSFKSLNSLAPCAIYRCHENATCTNYPFYAECSCMHGFVGDGIHHCDGNFLLQS